MRVHVKAIRVLEEAVREGVKVPIEVVGVPKEAVSVQHSHGLYNTLTTVRKFYYTPKAYL